MVDGLCCGAVVLDAAHIVVRGASGGFAEFYPVGIVTECYGVGIDRDVVGQIEVAVRHRHVLVLILCEVAFDVVHIVRTAGAAVVFEPKGGIPGIHDAREAVGPVGILVVVRQLVDGLQAAQSAIIKINL